MKIYKNQTVFDAALDRIRLLFDEFPNVVVSFSGGKDSTVTLELALIVAREKNRLPLKVLFIDQEAEWQMVIDYQRITLARPEILPLWYQVPFRIENATSRFQRYLRIWDDNLEPDQWIRKKDPMAIHRPPYSPKEDTEFYELFNELIKHNCNGPVANLGGVRCEESPSRAVGLTHYPTYKYITWGKFLDKKENRFTFYPIYDWSYTDVWKAIHDNKWPYCKLYDAQYNQGVPVMKMRVSNLHHETAVHALFYLQEVEPKTYEALCRRMPGIHMAGKLGKNDYFVKELPHMFGTWKEYRDYLIKHLVEDEKWQARFKKKFATMDKVYEPTYTGQVQKIQIQSILTNDWLGTKCKNWENNPDRVMYRKRRRGVEVW